jgi:hypothetical protein
MRSIDEILDQAKLAERTVPLYLGGDRDLQLRYEKLERRLPDAKGAAPDSLGQGSPARAIEDEMAAIREQMRESTVDIRIRALRRRAYRELCDAHPPRKTEDGGVHPDDYVGVNTDSIWEPLVLASIVEPKLTAEQTELLLGVLTSAQFEQLALACHGLNRGVPDLPFSSAASATTGTSAAG